MEALELVIEGVAAGIAGGGAMTAVDTLEQRLTGRPDVLVAPAPDELEREARARGIGPADLIARGPGERGPG